MYAGVSGRRIFLTDSTRDVIPAYRTSVEMSMEVRYSTRPCPKGCFLSGSFPASLVPTIVIRDEAASERLLTASSVTAMERDRIPITALNVERNRFARIPITLVRTITASLEESRSVNRFLMSTKYLLVMACVP